MNEARKYPLWREFVESESIDFGSSWSVETLAKKLECDPTSVEFQFAIDSIRRAIRRHGMYLSSAGSNGLIYRVVEAHQNADVMQRMQRRAIRSMRASVELGANTPRELLDAEQQRRHEAILERASTRLALINRSGKLIA